MFDRFSKSNMRPWLGVLFLISLTLCLWLGNLSLITEQATIGELVNAQDTNTTQQVNQGIERYARGDYRGAISLWKEALKVYEKSNEAATIAIVNENLARAYQQLGDTQATLAYWEKVIYYYQTIGNLQKVGQVLTEQAQAYSNLGQPGKAIALLCGANYDKSQGKLECLPGSALQIAREQQDKLGEVAALGSLGEAYRLRGDYNEAIDYLESALEEAKIYNNPAYIVLVLNSLGNTHASRAQLWNLRAKSAAKRGIPKGKEFQTNAREDYQKALSYFQSSFKQSQEQDYKSAQMRSLLNLIQLYERTQDLNLVDSATINVDIQQALELLAHLPDSVTKVYAAIDLANVPDGDSNITSPLTQCSVKGKLADAQATTILNQAIEIAHKLQATRAESYALGALGHFYECRKAYQKAWTLTQKALLLADQNLQAKDSLYLWEWQAGRILQKQNKEAQAIPFYQRAYNTLDKIRSDILIAERDLQFDFRDVIEPVYRQLAQFRIELASRDEENRNKELNLALETVNSLKLAELQNYFGNDCILAAINNTQVDELLEQNTAVFSSIILDDGTAMILTLPNKEKHLHWIELSQKDFRNQIEKFRQGLIDGQLSINYDTTDAETLYDLMILPFEDYLTSQLIETIVFIQDSFLRDIPMAALYDKKARKYLIENYAIATTPSLSLTAPKKLNTQTGRALILGVSKEAIIDELPFRALPSVPLEIKEVQKIFPNHKQFIDEDFEPKKLEKEIQDTVYPVIHIATHAQFGIISEDTFLVTGNNNKLTINELETVLRQVSGGSASVELLALTACQTAVGDERSSLGLAGVALQVGVRSAMASLWSVGDESTSLLVKEFYINVHQLGMSKAKALQAAQIKLLKAKEISEINDQYDNPSFWAPFIMIGNWL
ncbi:MAG: CHAT domain-containing protein [Moorea sp. SIO4A3]|nr:CHAT domain-containing protein [Moorena sp. SIO4A3]